MARRQTGKSRLIPPLRHPYTEKRHIAVTLPRFCLKQAPPTGQVQNS